jgi:hypothetical protein
MKRVHSFTVACFALLLVAGIAFAQGDEKKAASSKPAKTPNATYLIESPHTPEECLNVMDEVNKAKQLSSWQWGCPEGNHTAYRMVQASSEEAALAMVPESVRGKAHAYKLTKMTPAQLEQVHKQHQ